MTFLSERDDGHSILREDVARADINAVAIECPITLAPTVIVESVEIIGPKEFEVCAVVAFARLIFIDFYPVDELVNRQNVVVPCADPTCVFVRPQVEAETLRF